METELLDGYGISYEKGLRSCMGDIVFYKKILGMFLRDTCFENAKTAHENRDYKELFSRMHELKGVSGNIALLSLQSATVPIVELLRAGTADDAEVDSLFAKVEEEYHRACEGVTIILGRV